MFFQHFFDSEDERSLNPTQFLHFAPNKINMAENMFNRKNNNFETAPTVFYDPKKQRFDFKKKKTLTHGDEGDKWSGLKNSIFTFGSIWIQTNIYILARIKNFN